MRKKKRYPNLTTLAKAQKRLERMYSTGLPSKVLEELTRCEAVHFILQHSEYNLIEAQYMTGYVWRTFPVIAQKVEELIIREKLNPPYSDLDLDDTLNKFLATLAELTSDQRYAAFKLLQEDYEDGHAVLMLLLDKLFLTTKLYSFTEQGNKQ